MEETPCLLCGASDGEIVYHAADLQLGLPGLFRYVRCQQCGLIYQTPRPVAAEMGRYYPDDYLPFDTGLSSRQGLIQGLRQRLVQYGLQKRCRPLLRARRMAGPGALLDIGCGPGHFLAAMQAHGWDVQGVETNPRAAQYGNQVLGVPIKTGALREGEFGAGTFDAVTLWDVLEHLHHPARTLQEIVRILRPGGILLLRVPVVDSLDARLFGSAWAGLDPPRHLVVFSQRTVEQMLVQQGLDVLRAWSLSGSHASFVLSLQFKARQKGESGLLSKIAKVVGSPLGAILGSPYFLAMDQLHLGPELTVLARKAKSDHD